MVSLCKEDYNEQEKITGKRWDFKKDELYYIEKWIFDSYYIKDHTEFGIIFGKYQTVFLNHFYDPDETLCVMRTKLIDKILND